MVSPLLRTKVSTMKHATILCVLISIASLKSGIRKLVPFLQPINAPLSVDDDVRIVHVISPYVVHNCDAPFCPVDQTQSIVMGSIVRAAEKSRGPVLLAAATLPKDADAAPPDFIRLPLT
eukprot:CAMPEP_0194321762 /NCGR_PEP_ID=MMETSP0171-20130528/17957_1 /TAXON_ID=218684 /ORGANISM="Corethron pennatum, Strain L29A3" /LENGTH=119 /DNA_ID=CAMNT_0039079775 /DNA_START=181 /DNA_END=537 /DNA_ORIENTATION=+